MKKTSKHIIKFIAAIYIFELLLPLQICALEPRNESDNISGGMNIEANSALLMEPKSGKIIFEKNSDIKYEPASVTKVMTMLLTMEKIHEKEISMSDKVTISENAKKMGGSTMLLDIGEIRTVEELLKGVAIASGNDAAVALAEYISGSEGEFVIQMNNKAKDLGMVNTTFKNCHGLPENGHVMTAKDIAIMSQELLKYEEILKFTGTYMETLSEGRRTPIEMVNHNKLVRFFDGCDGLKTGFTSKAKYCISATAKRDGVRMLAVIMGAPTYKKRNRDASILMNHGFSKFQKVEIFKKGDKVEKITFNKNGSKYLIAQANEDFSITIERNKKSEKIDKKIILDMKKKAYKKGDIIGKCEIYFEDIKVGEFEICSDRDIKIGGFMNNLINNIKDLYDYAI